MGSRAGWKEGERDAGREEGMTTRRKKQGGSVGGRQEGGETRRETGWRI